MPANASGHHAYVTFRLLGGRPVSAGEVVAEVARQPLDGVLGCLGALSHDLLRAGGDAFDPRLQGHYLNLAIADDWPARLSNAHRMYLAGRVPATGKYHTLVHEQNLAWLAHAALLHARPDATTQQLSPSLQSRVCRILLIVNDLLPSWSRATPSILSERRAFAVQWLRHAQFNLFFEHFVATMLKLARQRIVMLAILPRYFDVESAFAAASGGVTLGRYFEILTVFISHFHHISADGRQWLPKAGLTSTVEAHADEIERIFGRWIRTPEEYRTVWAQRQASGVSDLAAGFDFVLLRQTPLIEARPGELVCPVFPLLIAKILDEPYFMISEHLPDPSQFHEAVGRAYEEYGHQLVERIAKGDQKDGWCIRRNVRDRRRGELADSYVQRDEFGVCFEHKAGRPSTEFLTGGGGNRVMGPCEAMLSRLENREQTSLKLGKDNDNGFLTRAMWQQSIAGSSLVRWAHREFGRPPSKLTPLITHLSELRVDDVCRRGYLTPLIEHAGLYAGEVWLGNPQWLHVSDLEMLAALADEGRLDLQALLNEKVQRSPDQRFDIFLFQRFEGNVVDRRLRDEVLSMLIATGQTFWLEDVSQGLNG